MSTVRIQVRRGTAAQWASVNPVLAGGEMGVETDTNKFKFGNGSDTWSALSYAAADAPEIGEISQDAINNALSVGSGLTKSYDDSANTISVGIDDTVVATKTYVDGQLSDLNSSLGNSLTDYIPVSDMGVANGVATLNSSGKVPSSQLSIDELAQDAVNTALVAGTGIAKSYDDTANTITISVDATTAEITEDTNLYYTDARARGAISSSDGIDYNQTTGVVKINNSVATRSYVDGKIADVVNAAPAALDTLKEIATSLNDNADFAGTMTTQLAGKAPIESPTFTGTVTIPAGASISGYLTEATADTTYETKSSATAYLKSTDAASTYETKADFRDDVRQTILVDSSTTYLTKTVDGTTKEITLNVNDAVIATKAHAEGYADTAASQAQTAATNAAEGYTDTAIATEVSNRNTAISSGVSTHNSTTANVHGISDTSKLVATTDTGTVATAMIAANAVTTAKIADSAITSAKIADGTIATGDIADSAITSAKIANDTIVDADISSSAAIAQSKISGLTSDLAAKAPLAGPTFTGTVVLPSTTSIGNVSSTEIGYVDGVTSAIQTQLDAKAPLAGPTFTGTATASNLTVTGNLTVNGTTTTVSSQNLEVSDPLIYIGTGNSANSKDLGVVGHFDNGTYQHTGIVRDATDGKWKVFSGVTTEPSDTIDFTTYTKDTVVLGTLEADSATIGNVSNTELQYLDGVTSAIQTQIDTKAPKANPTFTGTVTVASAGIAFTDGTQTKEGVPSRTPINQQSASYTTVLTDRDSLVEINNASATTVTIPPNSSVAYPVGTSIDILQTGAGQVTIAAGSGVTVNATPGLKLRTQWSSATLFKRATDTWVVFGDLSA